MTIATGDQIDKFGASVDTITTGTPGSIANAAFSAAGDVAAWTNDEDAPLAQFFLTAQWATVTGVANKRVILYARLLNVDGTTDAVAPSANRKSIQIGAFNVYAASTGTNYLFESGLVRLPNAKASQEYEFYLENQSGQTISSGWALKMQTIAPGPAA